MAKNFEELRKKMPPEARERARALAEKEIKRLLRSNPARQDVSPDPGKPKTEN